MNFKYIYCILNTGREVKTGLKGFAGQELYSLSYRDISALVSDVSGVDYNIDNILLHEEVNERMMADYIVLPMRFATVLDSTGKVRIMLERYYEKFLRNFQSIGDKQEFGLKIIWPVGQIKREICSEISFSTLPEGLTGQSPGSTYLKARFKEHLIGRALAAKAERLFREVNSILAPCFAEFKAKTLVTEKMVLSAAYLVPPNQVSDFRDRVAAMIRHYLELNFLLTGPWPPYHFASLELRPPEFDR